jgi:hypothetical protein
VTDVSPVQLEGIAASKQRGAAAAQVPIVRPAVVTAVDATGTTATCIADGPNGVEFGAKIIYPTGIIPGDRVMLMYMPPRVFLIGRQGGDFDSWHVVGNEGEPPFASGWVNAAGSQLLNVEGSAQTMFRRHGRIVELRGLPGRASGSTNLVFTLPPNYRPENMLTFPVVQGVGPDVGFMLIHINGDVELFVPAPGTGTPIDGIMFSTNPVQES